MRGHRLPVEPLPAWGLTMKTILLEAKAVTYCLEWYRRRNGEETLRNIILYFFLTFLCAYTPSSVKRKKE